MLAKASRFATNTFLIWMLVAAVIGFIFPQTLAQLGGYVPYLLGIVMLGMGLRLTRKISRLSFKHHVPLSLG